MSQSSGRGPRRRRQRQRPLTSDDRSSFSSSNPHYAVILLFCLLNGHGASSEKAYPHGCSDKPPSYYDYEHDYEFPPSTLPIKSFDDYLITRRLGTGKFSDVFEAVDVHKEKKRVTSSSSSSSSLQSTTVIDPRALVVLKCLKPVAERKIRREILVLERASKLPNLARLLGIVMSPEYLNKNIDNKNNSHSEGNHLATHNNTDLPRMPALVLQHAGPNSQWLCHGATAVSMKQPPSTLQNNDPQGNDETSLYLSDYEIRYYLYHLLTALDCLHKAGIMHRDVKPRNVLINRRHRYRSYYLHHHHHYHHHALLPCMLIDLGLADFYHPMAAYNVRVASRHYKAPELLLGYPYYDYAIDMWGVGCILVGLLLRREPFFRGKDNLDQLGKIVSVLGTDDLWAFVHKYQVQLSHDVQQELNKYTTSQLPATAAPANVSSSTLPDAIGRFRHRQSWLNFVPSSLSTDLGSDQSSRASVDHISRDALDLLDRLLVYDHEQRWTARQAMQHRYFDVVRERVQAEVRMNRDRQERSAAASR